MPETFFEKIKKNTPKTWTSCLFAALLVGFLAHFYKITNWIPNWDSLVFRYDGQNMLRLGRWLLGIVCAPGSFYDLPWLSGVFAILFHALGTVCIVAMFRLKKTCTAALIGALTVTFPTVTSVLMYNYVADGYAIAFFLACLAALLMTQNKPHYLLGALCITLSVAIYQAYITVTAMLLVVYLIDALLLEKMRVEVLRKKTVAFALAGLGGMVLYYLVLLALLHLTGTTLLEYQGVSSSVSVANIDLKASLYVICKSFINFFFDFSNGAGVYNVLNCSVFTLLAVFGVAAFVRARLYTSAGKCILFCILIVLLPIAALLLAVINVQADYHNLMKMGYVVFYIFFLLFYERLQFENKKLTAAKVWSVLLVGILLISNQVVLANVCYHKAQMAYEKSYGVLMRIADRIEQTEGAKGCTQIVVVGALDGSEGYSVNLPPDMTGITDGLILRFDDESVGQSVVCSALNDYCNTNYTFVYGAQKQQLVQTKTVQDMPVWPDKESIAVQDGILIVKLGAEVK